ncbi:MAG: hypothetical protein KIT83_12795 [Bryobacterales bacterium]|nr:hypothetical protein [Bryobacterales bacterium]
MAGQAALWIRNAKEQSANLSPDRDGRVRLRGPETLDICASPARFGDAITVFAGWLEALHQAGIATAVRGADGWRVCASIGGAVLVIRVRERLVHAPALGSANQRLERWLGGKRREVLTPSGVLELQVMRHGVCAVAVPVQEETAAEAYSEAIRAIQSLKNRALSQQQKARARAEMRRCAPSVTAVAAAVPQTEVPLETGVQSDISGPRFAPPQSGSDTQLVADLLRRLEATLRRMQPVVTESLSMRTSLDRLATKCHVPVGSADDVGMAALRAVLEAGNGNTRAPRPVLAKRNQEVA